MVKIRLLLILSVFLLFNVSFVSAFDYTICHNNSDCINYGAFNVTQPAKGQNFTDPYTHMPVTRISSGTQDLYIQYARYSSVSSDGRYLITAQNKIFDLKNNYQDLGDAPHINGGDPYSYENCGGAIEYRWDYTGQHPTRIYYRYATRFYQGDIITKNNTLIRDFALDFPSSPAVCSIQNEDEGDSSADSRYWVFEVLGQYNNTLGRYQLWYIFTYDKDYDLYYPDDDGRPGKIISVVNRSVMASWGNVSFSGLAPEEIRRPNFVDMSPSGETVLASWVWGTGGSGSPVDGPQVFNRTFGNKLKLAYDSTHSGWGYDYNGEEVYVFQNSASDYISMAYPKTGQVVPIKYHEQFGGWDAGFHFNRFYNSSKKGWILMTIYTRNYDGWGYNQMFMLELKPNSQNPRIWRINDPMNLYHDYYTEGFAAMDVQSTKAFIGANWRNTDNQEIYMSNLPETWWEDLAGINTSQTCAQAGGICRTSPCVNYTNCSSRVGTCNIGYCCLGGCANQTQNQTNQTNQTVYHAADTNQNSYLELNEIMNYVRQFKLGTVTRTNVLDGVMNFFKGRYN